MEPSAPPKGVTRIRIANPSLLNQRARDARRAWLAKTGKAPSMRLGRFSGKTVRRVLVLWIVCLAAAVVILVVR